MGLFKIDDKTKKALENEGRKIANKLADDAKEKLCNKYIELIQAYYDYYDPNGYERTFQLFKSYRPYKNNPHNTIYYGGITITADKMKNYQTGYEMRHNEKGTFSAQRLLDKYIYTTTLPSATWHGGDWAGGYGVMNSFSIYDEMMKYHQYLLRDYTEKCAVK